MLRHSLSTVILIAFALCDAARSDTPAQDAGGDRRQIQIGDIFTTSSQSGAKAVREAIEANKIKRAHEIAAGCLGQVFSASAGATNIFLVDAIDIQAAIGATYSVVVGTRDADTPATENRTRPSTGAYWLVVYLGRGPSSPPRWTVTGVDIREKRIALQYQISPPAPATSDSVPYYYWVCLGNLDAGLYELALTDGDGIDSLVRRVKVSTKDGAR